MFSTLEKAPHFGDFITFSWQRSTFFHGQATANSQQPSHSVFIYTSQHPDSSMTKWLWNKKPYLDSQKGKDSVLHFHALNGSRDHPGTE
jgi:hypothetical protein